MKKAQQLKTTPVPAIPVPATPVTAPTHEQLTALAQEYASAVISRQAVVGALRRRLADVAAEMTATVSAAVAAERDCRDALETAVEDAAVLFVKPRTRTVCGIRYGWTKGKARIEIPDEDETVKRIERLLPEEQQVLLLRRTVKVDRTAVKDLTTADLRRLAIVQHPGEDAVTVKVAEDAVAALVDTLLADAGTAGGVA